MLADSTVLLIRHAEKPDSGKGLSPMGQARADGYAAYFPSKGAVTTLTRTLAVELAHRNPRVRVNCVMPGPVMLPPDLPEEERRQAINATLVKREGSPNNIALAVLSFLDNDFVTGACLPVDGGRTVYAPE